MQEPIEYAPPKYIFLNLVTILCPDQTKQKENVMQSLRTQENSPSLATLGFFALSEDLDTPVKEKLFSTLEQIELPSSVTYNHSAELYIGDQQKAPPIFCAFLTMNNDNGTKLYEEYIKEYFKKQENLFKPAQPKEVSWWSPSSWIPDSSGIKSTLLFDVLDLMFNNNRRNTVLELCTKMRSILEGIKQEGLKIIITANMPDSDCRALLQKHNLHDFPTHVHTSETTGHLTPQKEFYESFIQKNKIKPEECLVIDDHKENLIGAQMLGMQALHKYNNDKFHEQLKTIITSKKPSEKQ
jgi:FMN phosphatase YigB (HAD superfamily)